MTYIRQVAEALQCAHDRKLIHRDVKPDNILLGEHEQVWLSDFGITTIAQSSRSLNTQDSAGTVHYMAPEQIQGKPRPASDQYALGIIAYEWICGERPFNGTPIEVAIQHAQAAPPPMRETVPMLSPAVEQVVMKALEKDYEKRFSNVGEFVRALAAAVEQTDPTLRKMSGRPFNETLTVAVEQTQLAPRNISITNERVNRGKRTNEQTQWMPPSLSEQWLGKGSTLQENGRYKEAIEAYQQAIALDPQNAYAYYMRGNAYDDLENYKRAIKDYDRAIELNPQHAEAYNDRGLAYANLNRFEQAIEDYDQAIELDPQVASAYGGRGLAFYALKDYETAIEDFDQAIELDPQYAVAYGGRGKAYYYLRDYRRAVQDFDYALRLDPDIDWFRSERDDAYRRLGRL